MKKLLAISILILSASTATFAMEEGGKCPMMGGKCHGMGEGKHGGWMKKFDANGDGTITRAEADAAHDAKFKSMDTNGDGSITKEEREAHHTKMKAEHEARRAEFMGKYDTDKDGKLSDGEKEVMKKERHAAKAAAQPAATPAAGN